MDGTTFEKIDRLLALELSCLDEDVATNETYYYYVISLDTSLNPSAPTNTISQTAEARRVAVTFKVTVSE